MIIKDVRSTLLRIPYVEPPRFSLSYDRPREIVVVEVETASGIVGLGYLQPLNGGLLIEGVEINGRSKEFTEGRAYVHFFPQGLSDEAVIKLGDRKNQHWSIVIHPLTGAAEIFNRSVTLKELKAK